MFCLSKIEYLLLCATKQDLTIYFSSNSENCDKKVLCISMCLLAKYNEKKMSMENGKLNLSFLFYFVLILEFHKIRRLCLQIQWNLTNPMKLTCLKGFHPPCRRISSVLRWFWNWFFQNKYSSLYVCGPLSNWRWTEFSFDSPTSS